MQNLPASSDLTLAQRIEAGHAASGLAVAVEAEQIAGGWALFHAIHSPGTQALGIGLSGPVTPEELTKLEAFFHERDTPAVIDLCQLADPSLLGMLQQRGYGVQEVSNVMVREIGEVTAPILPVNVSIEPVQSLEYSDWARLAMQGFMDTEDVPEEQVALLSATASNFQAYFAIQGCGRVGTAGMDIKNGLTTLFGDTTTPASRRQGVQLKTILHRIHVASLAGCDLASASVLPGSASQRNYERAGFHIVYARTLFSL